MSAPLNETTTPLNSQPYWDPQPYYRLVIETGHEGPDADVSAPLVFIAHQQFTSLSAAVSAAASCAVRPVVQEWQRGHWVDVPHENPGAASADEPVSVPAERLTDAQFEELLHYLPMTYDGLPMEELPEWMAGHRVGSGPGYWEYGWLGPDGGTLALLQELAAERRLHAAAASPVRRRADRLAAEYANAEVSGHSRDQWRGLVAEQRTELGYREWAASCQLEEEESEPPF